MAKNLLKRKGITKIKEIRIDLNPSEAQKMLKRTGRRTIPQIFIGETHVGGFDDLKTLNRTGQLDKLLNL